jgi:DNA polymerase Ligase (LigD)
MPRFVVLTHDHPFLHWDLMLEQGNVLRTWRLKTSPDRKWPIVAETLPDHRIAYLDYEGPISADRGTVQRWDVGTYEILEQARDRIVLQLAGKKLIGIAPIMRWSAEAYLSDFWTFWMLPPKRIAPAIEIPHLLRALIAEGRWPATGDEAAEQNRKPIVAEDRVRRVVPEENLIYLQAPPFPTVWESALHNPFWCELASAPCGIDFDLAIPIGDFGMGSDAPILLDYRQSVEDPRVIRLQRSECVDLNEWVVMADDFPSFVDALGL